MFKFINTKCGWVKGFIGSCASHCYLQVLYQMTRRIAASRKLRPNHAECKHNRSLGWLFRQPAFNLPLHFPAQVYFMHTSAEDKWNEVCSIIDPVNNILVKWWIVLGVQGHLAGLWLQDMLLQYNTRTAYSLSVSISYCTLLLVNTSTPLFLIYKLMSNPIPYRKKFLNSWKLLKT